MQVQGLGSGVPGTGFDFDSYSHADLCLGSQCNCRSVGLCFACMYVHYWIIQMKFPQVRTAMMLTRPHINNSIQCTSHCAQLANTT